MTTCNPYCNVSGVGSLKPVPVESTTEHGHCNKSDDQEIAETSF